MKNILSTHSIPSSDIVSVVVVSLRKGELLSRCLDALLAQTYGDIECFVVLNQADVLEAEVWKGRYPDVTFEYYPENELYCKPLNRGIRSTRGDYILCLNDDVVLFPDFIENAYNAIRRDGGIGSVCGCLLREDGETVDSAGFQWVRSRRPCDRGYGKKTLEKFRRDGYCFGVNGAAALYRRAMLEEIKIGDEYFDEDLGFYYEDYDLSWRAHKRGWKAYYCARALARHTRGATARARHDASYAITNISSELAVRLLRNRYVTMIKNDKVPRFLWDLPWIFSYEIRLFVYVVFFRPDVLRSVLADRSYFTRAFEKRRSLESLQCH